MGTVQANVFIIGLIYILTCSQYAVQGQGLACSVLPNITNGYSAWASSGQPVYAFVFCDYGFYSSTNYTISCTVDGGWEDVECVAKDCEDVPLIENGEVILSDKSNTSYGSLAHVSCYEGFLPVNEEITCTGSGQWEDWEQIVECAPINCSSLPDISNGSAILDHPTNTSYGATARVFCDNGYAPAIEELTCSDLGVWTTLDTDTICTIKHCGEFLPQISNGEVILVDSSNISYGSIARVHCDVGYVPFMENITCLETGQWEGYESFAACNPIVCTEDPVIEHGTALIFDGDNVYGSLAYIECNNGYHTMTSNITCTQSGKWENTSCYYTGCDPVPSIDHGYVIPDNGNQSTTADILCDDGHAPSSLYIQCQTDGSWPDNVTCLPYDLGNVYVQPGEIKTAETHSTFIQCAFSISDGLMYRIKWYFFNVDFFDTGVIPGSQAREYILPDDILPNIGIDPILGARIKCSVSVFDGEGEDEYQNKTSEDFVPIQLSTTSIFMMRGETYTFSVFLNVPFGCPLNADTCVLSFLVHDPEDNYDCRDSTIAVVHEDTSGGKLMIDTTAGVSSFTSTVINITITTKNNRYYRLRTYFKPIIMMSATGNTKWVWNQQLAELPVFVTDNYLTRYRGCYSFVDPYHYTYDRRYFCNPFVGEFVLFRHTTLPIEVQIITSPCNRNRATCACAVTVRSGGDIFTINHCGGHKTGYLSYKDGILKVYKWYTNYYRIVFPTGMQAFVYVMPYFDFAMNIYIIPAPSDFNHVQGLCGNYNGDRDDDTILRGTNQRSSGEQDTSTSWWFWWMWWTEYFYPNDFTSSWSLHDTIYANESLLNTETYNNVESWPVDKKLCVCPDLQSKTSICSADEEATCTGTLYWRYGTLLPTTIIGKRHVDNGKNKMLIKDELVDKRLQRMRENWIWNRDMFAHHIMKRQVDNITAISNDDARALCEEELDNCASYSKKEDVKDVVDSSDNLDNCARDVQIDGTTTWTQPHCDAVTMKLKPALEQDVEFSENNTDLVNYIEDNSCPGNCSGHGDCIQGLCVCFEGFGTDLCLLLLSIPPILVEYGDEGLCDVSSGSTCDFILIVSDGFIEDPWCSVEAYIAGNNGIFHKIDEFITPCIYINYNEVYAPTVNPNQSVRRRRDTDATSSTFARKFSISVSNDGINYGTPQTVTVLDTTCQETDGNVTADSVVTLMTGYCYISGTCYMEGEYRPDSSCDICDTTSKSFGWTDVCATTDADNTLAIIIGVVCGLVVITIIAVITIIYVYKKSKKTTAPELPKFRSNAKTWFDPKCLDREGILPESPRRYEGKRKLSVGINGETNSNEAYC
ncbi:hypothetical protein ACF0H5_020291 [Mactra antiquata]